MEELRACKCALEHHAVSRPHSARKVGQLGGRARSGDEPQYQLRISVQYMFIGLKNVFHCSWVSKIVYLIKLVLLADPVMELSKVPMEPT